MATSKKFSQLPAASSITNNDLAAIAHEDELAETGYESQKATVVQLAKKILGETEYVTDLPSFPEGKQNPFDALEDLKSSIEGLIDDTDTTSDSVWSSEKTDSEIINVLPTSYSRGTIAYFKTNIVSPLVRIVADANATKVYQRGVNFWDEASELGNLDESTGLPTTDNNRLRSKNYCPIKEGLNFYVVKGGSGNLNLYFYDTNKAFISKTGWLPSGRIITTPTGTCYFKIVLAVQYGTTYNHDVGVLFPSSQTNYEAYIGSEYAVSDLSDIITLKGINNLFADVGEVEDCEFKTDISNNYIKKEIDDNTRAIEANCYNLYPALNLDGYVNSYGIINVDPTAKRTDYINIVGYTTVIAVTSINSTGYAIAFFDENQQIISGVLGDGAKTYTASIPANAHFAIISQYGYPSATAKIINEGNLEEQINAIRLDYIDERAAFSAFAKFGVCGDSLSVGTTKDASGTNHIRNIYYSWGQYIARDYGNVCLNFGKSGMTAKGWMSDDKCYDRVIVADNKCQCYIIGLGANDAENLQDYSDGIGTTEDIDFNDMSNNADSFCGWYAKIINTINTINPTAIVFLLTLGYPRDTNADVKSINQAIINMSTLAGFSNVMLVDLRDYDDYLKKHGLVGQVLGGHYSALGYANVARIIEHAISKVMNAYNKDTLLFEIPFIPYGSNNVLD